MLIDYNLQMISLQFWRCKVPSSMRWVVIISFIGIEEIGSEAKEAREEGDEEATSRIHTYKGIFHIDSCRKPFPSSINM